MILSLHIENLGVIERSVARARPGRHRGLSGETGAGKTMLFDPIDLLVGDRADASIVGPGDPKPYRRTLRVHDARRSRRAGAQPCRSGEGTLSGVRQRTAGHGTTFAEITVKPSNCTDSTVTRAWCRRPPNGTPSTSTRRIDLEPLRDAVPA